MVVLLDGITRLGRAYNLAAPAAAGSCPVASTPRRSTRRRSSSVRPATSRSGGSLTILATALIETGSKMDEVIFEEFKGTGNMEIRLRREFADKRIFPAIDVDASSTRREELLMSKEELDIVWKLRRVLSGLDSQQGLRCCSTGCARRQSNTEFLMAITKSIPDATTSPGILQAGRLAVRFATGRSLRQNDLGAGSRLSATSRRPGDHDKGETMKPDIHPAYVETQVTCTCGNTFTTRSTAPNGVIHADVCSACHPFYTGKQKILDTGGRVARFEKRYAAKKRHQEVAIALQQRREAGTLSCRPSLAASRSPRCQRQRP